MKLNLKIEIVTDNDGEMHLTVDDDRFTINNSYNNFGLTPGPISNVTQSSLMAVAHPASTDWLYFVSGDDGITYFSRTLAEHEALVQQHCKKNCGL